MRTRVLTLAAAVGLALVVLPALPASAKGLSQSQINALENNLNHAKKLTYQVTYTSTESGKTSTITIAQAPPKSNFTTSDGSSVISTGKATYYCSLELERELRLVRELGELRQLRQLRVDDHDDEGGGSAMHHREWGEPAARH